MTFRPQALIEHVPDVDLLLAMSPAELGHVLLRIAKSAQQSGMFHEAVVTNAGQSGFTGGDPGAPRYPRDKEAAVSRALAEAWAWLRAELLVIPADGINGRNGHMIFGRRAEDVLESTDISGYRSASEFPKSLLHPVVAERVWMHLARKDLEEAISAGMKAVEIAVRRAGKYTADDIGAPLMKKAFHPDNGPLTDMDSARGERVGRMELFAGALGCFKNPSSHRDVPLTLPEAREMLMTASYLMRVVDDRAKYIEK